MREENIEYQRVILSMKMDLLYVDRLLPPVSD